MDFPLLRWWFSDFCLWFFAFPFVFYLFSYSWVLGNCLLGSGTRCPLQVILWWLSLQKNYKALPPFGLLVFWLLSIRSLLVPLSFPLSDLKERREIALTYRSEFPLKVFLWWLSPRNICDVFHPFGLLGFWGFSIRGLFSTLSFYVSRIPESWLIDLDYGYRYKLKVFLWWLSPRKFYKWSPSFGLLVLWFFNVEVLLSTFFPFQIFQSAGTLLWCMSLSFLWRYLCNCCLCETFAGYYPLLDCWFSDLLSLKGLLPLHIFRLQIFLSVGTLY